jgi:putative hydrolase of the HAD superfamily
MPIRVVFFDFGGVLMRTEHQAPRQHLAESLNMEYEDLERVIFGSPTARQATVGEISEEEHWKAVMQKLRLPEDQTSRVKDEFFGGDLFDPTMLDFLRVTHPECRLGLISNAWSGLRAYLAERKLAEPFEQLIVSAEVGVAKPDARIFQIALEKMNVPAAEVVFMDDFIENVEGARAAGMQAVHFKSQDEALKELKQVLRGG